MCAVQNKIPRCLRGNEPDKTKGVIFKALKTSRARGTGVDRSVLFEWPAPDHIFTTCIYIYTHSYTHIRESYF